MNRFADIAGRIAADAVWQPDVTAEKVEDALVQFQRAAGTTNREIGLLVKTTLSMSIQLGSRSEVMSVSRQLSSAKQSVSAAITAGSQLLAAIEAVQDDFTRSAQGE